MVVEAKAEPRALASFQLLQQPLRFRRQRSAQGAAAREVGFSFRKLALHQPRDAAIHIDIGPSWSEPQRLIVVGDGPREISFAAPYVAAKGPGVSRPRVKFKRVAQIRQCSREAAFNDPNSATIDVERRMT